METNSSASRWWENYLVRYFMPSIAGVGIIAWLCAISPSNIKEILFFGKSPNSIDAPTLTLLILYGNLFCYISSYPILVFHATRAIDFKEYSWLPTPRDGYISTLLLAILLIPTIIFTSGYTSLFLIFTLLIMFTTIQLHRIYKSLSLPKIDGYNTKTSLQYAYLVALSKRRGMLPVKTTTKNKEDDELSEETTEEQNKWRQDLVESYKHMREHGNSAFIFVLELLLATVCYGIIASPTVTGVSTLAFLAVVFAFWSIPAVFVHFLGQHLERRYAKSDHKIHW